jgi:NADPH:quinone reductase-like Zn-dependent oxidoreductase
VLGAGGAVGQAAIQLARLYGAAQVVGAARSHDGQQRALAAGADAVVALDTDSDTNAADGVAELAARLGTAADGPVDLVLDPLFGVPAAAAARCLRPGGRLVNLGGSADEQCPLDSSTIRSRSLRLLGYTNNELTREQKAEAMTAVARHAAAGELSVAHEVVPLEDAPDAWRRQAEGRTTGRLVLVPGR